MKTRFQILTVAAFARLLPSLSSAFAQDWTLTSAPNLPWTSIASSADGTKLVAVASGNSSTFDGQVYTSTNSGGSWTNNHNNTLGEIWKAVASSADGATLVAGGYYEYFSGQIAGSFAESWIYTSTNSDASWAGIEQLSWNSSYSSFGEWNAVASSADGTRLVATSAAGLFGGQPMSISTDSGATWTPTGSPSSGLTAVSSSADGKKLVAVGYYVYTSTDSGATWTQTSAPYELWTSVASSADGTRLVAAAGGGGTARNSPIYTSADSGATWTQTSAPLINWTSVASSADGAKLLASASAHTRSTFGGVYTSTNSGATWTSNNVPSDFSQYYSSVVASSADGTKLVAVVKGGGIYTSQSTPTPLLSLSPSGTNTVVSWTIPSLAFTLQQNPDLTTTNWTDVTTPPVLNLTNLQNQVIVSPTNGNTFYRLKH